MEHQPVLGMGACVHRRHHLRGIDTEIYENKEGKETTTETLTNISQVTAMNNMTSTLLAILPMLVMLGTIVFIFGSFWGGIDGDGFSYGLRKWWWVIALGLLPIFIMIGGGDWMFLIFFLIALLVGGALFFWWLEHDFELPKGDPVKKGLKWFRENFRL